MGSGYKVNAVYGGRPISKDKIELKHTLDDAIENEDIDIINKLVFIFDFTILF